MYNKCLSCYYIVSHWTSLVRTVHFFFLSIQFFVKMVTSGQGTIKFYLNTLFLFFFINNSMLINNNNTRIHVDYSKKPLNDSSSAYLNNKC